MTLSAPVDLDAAPVASIIVAKRFNLQWLQDAYDQRLDNFFGRRFPQKSREENEAASDKLISSAWIVATESVAKRRTRMRVFTVSAAVLAASAFGASFLPAPWLETVGNHAHSVVSMVPTNWIDTAKNIPSAATSLLPTSWIETVSNASASAIALIPETWGEAVKTGISSTAALIPTAVADTVKERAVSATISASLLSLAFLSMLKTPARVTPEVATGAKGHRGVYRQAERFIKRYVKALHRKQSF